VTKSACTLDWILEQLVSQDIVEQDKASMVTSLVSAQDRKNLHPLEIIASRDWSNKSRPEQMLTLDMLTDWLATQSDHSRYHFDPLKMDVASCTSIMSYAYASRFGILAVEVTETEVVVAVTDPWNLEWKDELDRIVNKPISTVLANPGQLKNYLIEFYSVSKAMEGAGNKSLGELPGNIQNLEQLIELGKTGKVDADDQQINISSVLSTG
jgi:general secretion pathway protein E